MILLLLAACRAPPEAPKTLDLLTAYIYSHQNDTETSELEAGLTELYGWLESAGTLEEHYEVGSLDDATVDALDGTDRSAVGMQGLAVVTQSIHAVEDAAYAMIAADLMEVYPDMFAEYSRTFYGDPQCFLDEECERIEALENTESHFAFGIVSISKVYNQYVWVEMESGAALVQRNWMIEPPDVNNAMLDLEEQFYMNLFIPKGDGFWRLQSTWMIPTKDAVDSDFAMGIIGNDLQANSDALDAFLSEQ
jgi:hypothetical protein